MKGLLLLFLICTAEAFIDLLEILEKRRHHLTSSAPEDDNKTAVADQSSITVDPKTLQLADDKLASGGVQWLDDYDDYETDDYEEYEDYYEYIHSPYRPTSNKPWSSSTIIPAPERLKCPKRRAKPFGGSPSLLAVSALFKPFNLSDSPVVCKPEDNGHQAIRFSLGQTAVLYCIVSF